MKNNLKRKSCYCSVYFKLNLAKSVFCRLFEISVSEKSDVNFHFHPISLYLNPNLNLNDVSVKKNALKNECDKIYLFSSCCFE